MVYDIDLDLSALDSRKLENRISYFFDFIKIRVRSYCKTRISRQKKKYATNFLKSDDFSKN
jgi:hypothetical protein